jgi:23S rRNA (cytidine1920-2'-O)/16S rRNA (cytidine1409-2'-O)-methyltransferase
MALLVKPQFEAGKVEASKGKGVISDPVVWRRVLAEVSTTLTELGAAIMGTMVSPITGSDGNVEFIVVGRTPGGTDPISGRQALSANGVTALLDDLIASIAPVVADELADDLAGA